MTDAIVTLHLRYFGRAPATARTELLSGDVLACVLTGIYTDAEKTTIDLEGPSAVHASRQKYQDPARNEFVEVVERLTGCPVLAFVTAYQVSPDAAMEVFRLDTEANPQWASLAGH